MDSVLNLITFSSLLKKLLRFIGLIYDNKMSFEPHIEYFKAKIPWISSKSSLAQNGVLIKLLYWKYVGRLKDQIEIMVA